MKKVLFISIILLYSCSSQRITEYTPKIGAETKTQTNISIPETKMVRTANPNLPYPYIHINGFKDYEIVKSKSIKIDGLTVYPNELRFNATYSSFYTKKVMYDNFGNWNKNLFFSGKRHPMLIWESVKLLNNKKELYYVIAFGLEITNSIPISKNNKIKHSIYASVIIFDSKGNDCLTDENPELKKQLIEYFSNGIKNLNSNDEFYDKYWTLIN